MLGAELFSLDWQKVGSSQSRGCNDGNPFAYRRLAKVLPMSTQNSNDLDTVELFGEQMGELINLVRGKSTSDTIIRRLIDFGFDFANTAPNRERREDLMLVALASMTTEVDGRMVGLTNQNLSKAVNYEVSNVAWLQNMQKGTISGVSTWRGNASSKLNTYRRRLQQALEQGGDPIAKNDGLDQVLLHIEKALTALGRLNSRDDGRMVATIEDIDTHLRAAEKTAKSHYFSN